MALTKKCFKLSIVFGGEIADYKDFVSEHLFKNITQIIEIYHKQNPSALTKKIGQKLINCMNKLAFYFDQEPSSFEAVVLRNPTLDFGDLVKICKDERKKAQQVKKSEELKVEEIKVQEKVQEPA